MSKRKHGKKPLTAAQRRAKRERKRTTMIIFIHGKQKRVPRPPTIEGLPVEEFIRHNADPVWCQMNEMWDEMPQADAAEDSSLDTQ